MTPSVALRVREYGTSATAAMQVVLVHGGPGAPGYLAPVARGLARWFRVVEPFQRGSDAARPLTVARHVADLDELLSGCAEGARVPEDSEDPGPGPGAETTRPALLGHSWGAMLALAYAAAHPARVGALILVGCGTFDSAARERMQANLEQRLGADLRQRLAALPVQFPDPDERLRAMGELILQPYSCELCSTDLELEACDARAHDESWQDMLRLQESGMYPAAFAAIDAPVLMLHGADDPHPGALIRDGLAPHLRHLEFRKWERCGHYPWLERAVRSTFFTAVRDWLTSRGSA